MQQEKVEEFLNLTKTIASRNRLAGTSGEWEALRYVRGIIEKKLKGKTVLQRFQILKMFRFVWLVSKHWLIL